MFLWKVFHTYGMLHQGKLGVSAICCIMNERTADTAPTLGISMRFLVRSRSAEVVATV